MNKQTIEYSYNEINQQVKGTNNITHSNMDKYQHVMLSGRRLTQKSLVEKSEQSLSLEGWGWREAEIDWERV